MCLLAKAGYSTRAPPSGKGRQAELSDFIMQRPAFLQIRGYGMLLLLASLDLHDRSYFFYFPAGFDV